MREGMMDKLTEKLWKVIVDFQETYVYCQTKAELENCIDISINQNLVDELNDIEKNPRKIYLDKNEFAILFPIYAKDEEKEIFNHDTGISHSDHVSLVVNGEERMRFIKKEG
jgi:hypothetical protein